MQIIFQNNKSDELVLFFNGWGMDERPFRNFKNTSDILFVSNYSDLNFNLPKDLTFSKYKRINLIAFSAGVFMSSFLWDKLPKIDSKIAVSGTLYLMDEARGISPSIKNEMKSLTLDNVLEFRQKLISDDKQLAMFNKNQPLRDLDSSLAELEALERYYTQGNNKNFEFDKVIIGENDQIIPYENQLKAWKNHQNIKTLKGGHFLFYEFNNFEEIIAFT